MLKMLTRKQFELLRFINERLKESGVPPSFDEMKDALDLRSKSGIHRLITALEAIQTRTHTIQVPPDLLSTGDHFALEVRGDSMIDAGILDGDTVLIRKGEGAETGDIVVALI